ncbi:MAG TPA: tyrosine/phenylalanine carboxypeptidase domain-containing protein [bacterium]|nr:tyrosine/phenylalanine carboxypeptidase domain-containing protein [bacterium]
MPPRPTIGTVEKLLRAGRGVRRRLPDGGRLQIDRLQPFLVVYRQVPGSPRDCATEQLLTHASSLLVLGEAGEGAELVERVARSGSQAFGGFLILEIWAGRECKSDEDPRFVIYGPKGLALIPLIETLQNELTTVTAAGSNAEVWVRRGLPPAPPGKEPLLTEPQADRLRAFRFGIEIPCCYRNPATGKAWPQILRLLRAELTTAFRRFAFEFLHQWTTLRPENFHVIGSRRIAPIFWQVDRQLAKVADSFDCLLQVTPVNSSETWQEFKKSRHERTPVFQYRPMPVEPTLLKRHLFAVPIEKVDDPALYRMFRGKQDELDRQITLLLDLNTPRFILGSIQLFGDVSDEEYRVAREMLRQLPPTVREKAAGPPLDASAFAKLAKAEIESFRRQWPGVAARVEVREDIHTGLMVSKGSVLIGADTEIPAARAQALIQHEVGTHVLTYWNGRAQPFKQLYSGLAGYDTLQEGIAVLAEALVGGLSRPRQRLLFGRVIAARLLIDGAGFVDTFRALHRDYGFPARTAFSITLRIYRGGGLTKDAVYVRGIGQLLDYLKRGNELEPLLIGKLAVDDLPLVQELRARQILVPPPLKPSYLEMPIAKQGLEKIRAGLTLFQTVRGQKPRPAKSE